MSLTGMKPVVCIGAAIVDLNFQCDSDPVLHTSNPSKLERSPGGVVRNVAHHLGLLGLPVELVTVFGNDPDGEWLAKQCTEANIGVGSSLWSDNPTGTFAAITTPSGELEIGVVSTHTESMFTVEFLEAKIPLFKNASVVIADCNLSVDALKMLIMVCDQYAIPLIIETVSVAKSQKLKKALPGKLLLVKPNLDEFNVLSSATGSSIENRIAQLHNQGIENIWLSLGSEGSVFSNGKERIRVTAPNVQIKDVSGAGDAAVAGWVYGWLHGKDLMNCVNYGNAAAACLLEVKGAVRNDLSPSLLLNYII